MVYVITSEYSRRMAHRLDDNLERWRLRRESSAHFDKVKSSIPLDELDKKYKRVIDLVRLARCLDDLYKARKEARRNLKLTEQKVTALKARIKLSKNQSEASLFSTTRKAMKPELAYCHDVIAQINQMIRENIR